MFGRFAGRFAKAARDKWNAASAQMTDFKENSAAAFFKWLAAYAAVAGFSAIMFNFGSMSMRDMIMSIFTLTALRMFTLFIFTCPVITLGKPRSAFAFMSSLWILWYAVAFGRTKVGIVLMLTFMLLSVFISLAEKARPAVRYASVIREISVLFIFAFFAVLVLQMFQMKSVIKPFGSFLLSPDVFSCNMLCFAGIGVFAFWAKRPKFALSFYSFLWAVLATISFLKSRNTFEPVLFLDVFSLKEGTKAFISYYKWYVIAGIALLAVAVIIGIIYFASREKKRAFSLMRFLCGAAFLIAAFCCVYLMSGLQIMNTESKTAKDEYDRKGFVYSFLFYSFDSFVVVPDGYAPTVIETINKNIEQNYVPYDEPSQVQNVIVIQLESFSDPYLFPGIVLERDPIPYIRTLMNDYSSGYVEVPVFGGLTVKSEFEFLTGLSIENLPLGYNPYVQYVYENSMDSMARYFKSEGYMTTAVHDYQGEFFERNQVYDKLGFDYFIPYECMPDIEKKPSRIWGNDEVFVNHIEQVLDANGDGKNFVFGVTVQTHGDYEPIPESEYPMLIRGIEDMDLLGSMEYYIQQIEYVDSMIEDLITMLSEREEATYVLFYSDHLPSLFANSNTELTNEQKYSTPYFTWNNMGITKAEKNDRPEDAPEYAPDMELFQLSTFMCRELSLDGSYMNKFHTLYADISQYEQEFSSIQYYKMYDEKDEKDLSNDDYKIGLYDLTVTSIEPNEDIGENSYIVHGSGFSLDTYFCINGRLVYPTELIDDTAVSVQIEEPEEDDTFTLRIIGEKLGGVLRESETYKWSDFVK